MYYSVTPMLIVETGFIKMPALGIDISTQVDHCTCKIDVDNTTLIPVEIDC